MLQFATVEPAQKRLLGKMKLVPYKRGSLTSESLKNVPVPENSLICGIFGNASSEDNVNDFYIASLRTAKLLI